MEIRVNTHRRPNRKSSLEWNWAKVNTIVVIKSIKCLDAAEKSKGLFSASDWPCGK